MPGADDEAARRDRAERLRREIAAIRAGAGREAPPRSPGRFVEERMRASPTIHDFDPGPVDEPFAPLARDYPGPDAYPPELFRVEWGPIFHRGRLDGSARVLVFGQDPGQHESIARRCMVGEAGQRVQGFLRKLGITRSYVIVNAYLYSVFGQPSEGGRAGRARRSALPRQVARRAADRQAGRRGSGLRRARPGRVHALARAARQPQGGGDLRPPPPPDLPGGVTPAGRDEEDAGPVECGLPRPARRALEARRAARHPTLRRRADAGRPRADPRGRSPGRIPAVGAVASAVGVPGGPPRPDATDAQRAEAKRATIVVRVPKPERPWKPLDA